MKALYALVGMKHRGSEALVASLKRGHPLLLIREADNPHDRNAVQVWANGEHIGYVRGTQVRPLAMKLDAPSWHQQSALTGRSCINASLAVSADRWPMIEVEE